MKLRFSTILFLVVVALAASSGYLNGQETRSKPSRQSSFEAFSKGNFEQAYSEFSQLLQVYPKDPQKNL